MHRNQAEEALLPVASVQLAKRKQNRNNDLVNKIYNTMSTSSGQPFEQDWNKGTRDQNLKRYVSASLHMHERTQTQNIDDMWPMVVSIEMTALLQ